MQTSNGKGSRSRTQASVLKWAGGKRWFLESLKPWLVKEHTTLVEPFVGGGSLFLNSNYDSYHLSDINPDLIELYEQIKRSPTQLVRQARPYFSGVFNHAEGYYELRARFNALSQGLQRSALLLYLNRHGYNGLCRYNRSGLYNVPFGRCHPPRLPEAQIFHFSKQAQRAQFYCESFEASFERAAEWKGVTIYCDPPYARGSARLPSFSQYHTSAFTSAHHRRLAQLAGEWASQPYRCVLISNHDSEEAQSWYQQAHKLVRFEAPRRIGAQSASRVPTWEILAIYLT